MDKVKKIIFIVLIIGVLGGLIFFLLNIFTDVFTFKDVDNKEIKFSEIQEVQETKTALEEAMEGESSKSEETKSLFDFVTNNPVEEKVNKTKDKYDKTGDLYLLNYGFSQVFNIICNRNRDWGLTALPEDHIVNMSNFLTQNMLDRYNEADGILDDINFSTITSIKYDPYNNILLVYYTNTKGNDCETKYTVEIIEEDGHQKINSVNCEYVINPDEMIDRKDYPVRDIRQTLIDIILLGYTDRDSRLRGGPGNSIMFVPSDELTKKYPNNKILGDEFDTIFDLDFYNEGDKEMIEDPDAHWVNIKVEWLNEKENYTFWNYYKIHYTLENYKLVDVRAEKEKSVRGSSNKKISLK